MKVVIQSTRTLKFLRADHSWEQNVTEALCFQTSMRALDFCIRHKLQDIQILLRFHDGTPDVILPVEEDWARLKSDVDA